MKPGICRACTGRDGLTLIEVLVIIALLLVLVAVTLPTSHRGDCHRSPRIQCINNLKQIAIGHHIWRADNAEMFPWEVPVAEGGTMEDAQQGLALPQFLVISNCVPAHRIFVCPSDKERKLAGNDADVTAANVSYFINTASNTNWPAGILLGDRNVALDGRRVGAGVVVIRANDQLSWAPGIHGKDAQTAGGTLAFLDGHVEFSQGNLQELFERSGLKTTRLSIP